MQYTRCDNPKVFNIDFDGTLTTGEFIDNPEPNLKIVLKSNELYMTGNIIIIWTARWWDEANLVISWLIRNKVKFHGIMMGKGGSDYYVDDKAVQILDFTKGDY